MSCRSTLESQRKATMRPICFFWVAAICGERVSAFSTNVQSTVITANQNAARQTFNHQRHATTRTICYADKNEGRKEGGTARFTGMEEVGGVTSLLDYVLSLISSDIGSIVLGLTGLTICLGHRLQSIDVLSTEAMGQETRSDLLAVFASGAVLLNGVSKLDVTSALAESVVLDGIYLPKPEYPGIGECAAKDDVTWALESVLTATPAKTAVILVDSAEGWTIAAVAGMVPNDPAVRTAPSSKVTPILDRFKKDTSKETYLPTLQALPGRVEFTYLPINMQEALLLPVQGQGRPTTVLVVGSDTAKSFSPRDIAWCQVIAARLGTFLKI